MVIECPDCSTRFAVDSHALAHIAEPTFHCSRCGNYFKQEEQGALGSKQSDSEHLSSQSQEDRTDLDSQEPQNKSEVIDHPETGSSAVATADESGSWSLGESNRQDEEISEPHVHYFSKSHASEQLPLICEKEIKNPNPLRYSYPGRNSNIDLDSLMDESSGSASVSAQWPSENTSSRSESRENTSAIARSASTGCDTDFASSVSIDSSPSRYTDNSWASAAASDDDTSSVAEALLPQAKAFQRTSVFKKPEFSLGAKKEPVKKESVSKRSTVSSSGRAARPEGSMGLLLSIPFICCLSFLIWGMNIEKTPAALKTFFSLDKAGLPSIPPAGLTLIGITPQVQALDSGHKLLEISGNVLNSTNDTYASLKLEARAFTRDNKETSRYIVPLDNALRDSEEFAALTPELINSMQKQSVAPHTVLSPNVLIPFRILIPALKGDEVWFSTRVYSSEMTP